MCTRRIITDRAIVDAQWLVVIVKHEQTTPLTNATKVYISMDRCELYHNNWTILTERDDEKIIGEYESCAK